MAGGLAADTPVAAVRSATTADQVTLRCRLDELGTSPLDSPAVIVIGPVAAFELVDHPAARSLSPRRAVRSGR